MLHPVFLLTFLTLLLSACTSPIPQTFPAPSPAITARSIPSLTATLLPPTPTLSPSPTATPQPHLPPQRFGPEREDFPPGVNPLTARFVEDLSWLDLPAVIVSISNMPVTTRPQAGINFASWVFELWIGEGTTRFLAVFYGNSVRFIPNPPAGCPVREEIIRPRGEWIGRRVWLDENGNGRADDWEVGIGGVCIRLLEAATQRVLAETSTDSNGYYAFDRPQQEVILEFQAGPSYAFTTPHIGDEDHDSDVDPVSGRTPPFRAEGTAPFWDAGLILLEAPSPTPRPAVTGTPENWFIPDEPYIGPIRSGRMTYNHISHMFWNSCLVFAGAGRGILERLNICELIYGVDPTTPNSALLTATRLRQLAERNRLEGQPVNYSGNLFSQDPPPGGQPATEIHVHYHAYTQSAWRYDPISHTYLRWTDLATGTGEPLVPARDRLTGRQQAFENVIVVFAEHLRIRYNQFEIDVGPYQRGRAYLFRDGLAFPIRWSTLSRAWEKQTGLPRPMYFLDANNQPIALRPGRTWIHLVTPFSYVEDQGQGHWLIRFVQPADWRDTPSP